MPHDVLLQRKAAPAAERVVRAAVVAMFGLRLPVRLPPQARLAIESQHTLLPFEPHLAHRAARIRRNVIVQAVAIEKPGRAARKFEHDVARILAGNDGIHLGGAMRRPP